MSPCLWQLENHRARFLDWMVDLAEPANGLHHAGVLRASVDHRLGVAFPLLPNDQRIPLVDCYARGPDLLAAYGTTDGWPVEIDVRWRVHAVSGEEPMVRSLDLIVSARTQRLDSHPGLTLHSVMPANEVLRLADPATGQFVPCTAQDGRWAVRDSLQPCCLLFRQPGCDSYVEMVHPVDFRESELRIGVPSGDTAEPVMEIRHRLFADFLEKGVILRARVRGSFLPRDRDARLGAESYAAFVGADVPLGT